MDPDLWELLEDGEASDEVAAIIRLGHHAVFPEGVRVITQFGDIVTVRMRRGDIPRLNGAAEVADMAAGDAYFGPDLEMSAEAPAEAASLEPGISDRRRPEGVKATGRGVVVGVVDWGFDFAHPDFRNTDGSTRILALWDQRAAPKPKAPQPFAYGVLHDQAALDRALRERDPYAALGYHPADSDTGIGCHGTHVASIAAGSGGPGRPEGIAPGGDLVLVHNAPWGENTSKKLGDSVTLLEAIDFISRTAGDRPWVVNLSMGRHGEQHDGTTLIEQGLDAAVRAARGRAICMSVGNYFDKRVHSYGQLRPTEQRQFIWEINEGDPTDNELEIWYSARDKMLVQISSPDDSISARVKLGERATLQSAGKNVGTVYHRANEPNNLDHHIDVFLYTAAPPGQWKVTLTAVDTVDGRFHAWIERDAACPRCQSRFRLEDAVRTSTTGTICNGLRTIAVGAYDNHREERNMAPFSSVGPTREGRLKPDLCAPGVNVLAARSSPRNPPADIPLLTRMSGTSMAAPHVTGTVALMFEVTPRRLRIDETRNLLLKTAARTSAQEEVPDRVGIGYLAIESAVEAARAGADPTIEVQSPARASVGEALASEAGPVESEQRKLHFILISGGPGPFDTGDVEHDQSWANYVTPPLLISPLEAANEDVWWFVYRPAYERRWADDMASSVPARRKAVRDTQEGGFASYVDKLEARARQRGWNLRWLNSADDLWPKLATFRRASISRVWYWGHASDGDLWLSLTHNELHQATAPAATEIIQKASIQPSLKNRFAASSASQLNRFVGCNTKGFAEHWAKAFDVWTEGVNGKVNFSAIEHTGGEPCLSSGATVHFFAPGGIMEDHPGWQKARLCSSLPTEALANASSPDSVPFVREAGAAPVADAGATFAELADQIVCELAPRGARAPMLQELISRSQPSSAAPMSTAVELFDALVYPSRGGLPARRRHDFEIVALPNATLEVSLREGDLLVRRGEGNHAHVAVIASPELRNVESASAEGGTPEGSEPGAYAQVIEGGSWPHRRADAFSRRITDEAGRLPADQLLLRRR